MYFFKVYSNEYMIYVKLWDGMNTMVSKIFFINLILKYDQFWYHYNWCDLSEMKRIGKSLSVDLK